MAKNSTGLPDNVTTRPRRSRTEESSIASMIASTAGTRDQDAPEPPAPKPNVTAAPEHRSTTPSPPAAVTTSGGRLSKPPRMPKVPLSTKLEHSTHKRLRYMEKKYDFNITDIVGDAIDDICDRYQVPPGDELPY